jgi:hypothetical protein
MNQPFPVQARKSPPGWDPGGLYATAEARPHRCTGTMLLCPRSAGGRSLRAIWFAMVNRSLRQAGRGHQPTKKPAPAEPGGLIQILAVRGALGRIQANDAAHWLTEKPAPTNQAGC